MLIAPTGSRQSIRRSSAALVLVGALGLSACADDGPPAAVPIAPAVTAPPTTSPPNDQGDVDDADSDPGPTVPVATVVVQSLDNIFRPEIIEVEVGTEVVWVNAGRTDHDVTPADPEATWGVTAEGFQPGDEYRLVFTEPGVYDYYCTIHGTATAGQIGTVVVLEPST